MTKTLLKKGFRWLRPWLYWLVMWPKVHSSAILTIHKHSSVYGKIVVGKNSSLLIEDNVLVNANLLIGDNCTVSIRKGSLLKNVTFVIQNNSIVEVGAGAIFNTPLRYHNEIVVDNGTLILAKNVRIQADILVRFGGKMTIGEYTGIGYGSEIRCEEQIDIGSYGLFSYEVCIYDTNTHSTDWQERRERIEKMYSSGIGEEKRPGTKPVCIGNDVWIGKGATILKGCVIGNRSVVGIRTVVSSEIYEDDSIIVSQKPKVISKKESSKNIGI